MAKTVVGIFEKQDHAEMVAHQIKERGLRTDDISIVAKKSDTGDPADRTKNDYTDGRARTNDNISDGTMTGGALGGLAGFLIGAGSIMVPGLGIVAAAGPIAGLLSGAVTGGIVGGLVDLGIPEEMSREYESNVRNGKIVFSMRTDDDKINQVTSILRRNGATSVNVH